MSLVFGLVFDEIVCNITRAMQYFYFQQIYRPNYFIDLIICWWFLYEQKTVGEKYKYYLVL